MSKSSWNQRSVAACMALRHVATSEALDGHGLTAERPADVEHGGTPGAPTHVAVIGAGSTISTRFASVSQTRSRIIEVPVRGSHVRRNRLFCGAPLNCDLEQTWLSRLGLIV